MEFQLTQEQGRLKEQARTFLEKEISPIVAEHDRRHCPLPKEVTVELFKKIAPLGFLGGIVPKKDGGSGLSYITYALLLEEFSRSCSGFAYMTTVHCSMGPLALSRLGTPVQKAKFLDKLMSGEWICGFAGTEPNVGSGARDYETTAVRDGNTYIINGTKVWITNGPVLDILGILVSTPKAGGGRATSWFIIEKSVSPFTARELPKLGFHCCPTGELILRNCKVPAENLVGQEGEALRLSHPLLLLGRCQHGIFAVGLAQGALDASVKWARENMQAGRPLGRSQIIEGMIADMAIETEAARLLSLKAFDVVEKGIATDKEPSIAKAYATEVAVKITSKAMQLYGTYGLSNAYPVERYFRDARILTMPEGTTEMQKLIVGREFSGIAAFT